MKYNAVWALVFAVPMGWGCGVTESVDDPALFSPPAVDFGPGDHPDAAPVVPDAALPEIDAALPAVDAAPPDAEHVAVCGDGVLDPGEACDDGNDHGQDGCTATCEVETLCCCGNGAVEPGEACDDGNEADGDGCSSACQLEPS